jgi:phage gp36-like protein
MPYCTIDDLKKLIAEETILRLTDDDNLDPASIDPSAPAQAAIVSRISEAIATSDAEIDGYCAAKYGVPLYPVPPLVKALSVQLTIYYLHKRRSSMPEEVEKGYDKASARLRDIAKGLLTLGVDPAPAPSADAAGAATNKTEGDRVFTRDSMKGF